MIASKLGWPKSGYERHRAKLGLLFISPWLIGFLLFKLVPILVSFGFALTDFHMLTPDETSFVGLSNYVAILTNEFTWIILFRTIGFAAISIPIQLFTALFLAALLNNDQIFGKQIYRTLIFLPSIIPGVAILSVWFGFLNPTSGWLNQLFLLPLGLPPYPGVRSEAGQNFFLVITALWSIGPSFLIMLGAMQGVPKELYEAARVDGAGPIFRFLRITVPIITPAIFFSLVISLVAIFGGAVLLDRGNAFNGGGQSPLDSAIYFMMFREFELGYAAGMAWLMFLLMITITILLFRSTKYWVHYPDGGL